MLILKQNYAATRSRPRNRLGSSFLFFFLISCSGQCCQPSVKITNTSIMVEGGSSVIRNLSDVKIKKKICNFI